MFVVFGVGTTKLVLMKFMIKALIIFYIVTLPVLAFSQSDSLKFKITLQNDSTFNFTSDNVEFYNYLIDQIDNRIEKGFFEKERVLVRCSLSDEGKIDSIFIMVSSGEIDTEISNALKKIDKFYLPEKYGIGQYNMFLMFRRWKESGELEITGWVIPIKE